MCAGAIRPDCLKPTSESVRCIRVPFTAWSYFTSENGSESPDWNAGRFAELQDREVLMHRVIAVLEAQRSLADDNNGANVLLQCGYFETNADTGGKLDEFARITLREGLALAQALKQRWPGTRIQYCTLVNDLGQVCGESVCSIDRLPSPANAETIQAEVRKALRDGGVAEAHHTFFFEKNLKNRGLRALKSQLAAKHPKLEQVTDEDDSTRIMLRTRPTQAIHLATRRGSSIIGKCPVIMGAFYREAFSQLSTRFYRDSRPQWVIDLCHVVDRDKVLRGIDVFRTFGPVQAARAVCEAEKVPLPKASLVPVFMDESGSDIFPHSAPL